MQGDGAKLSLGCVGGVEGKRNKDGLGGGGPSGRPRPPPPPLLGDALGQLRAGGRGVGREDSVAGAGSIHGRACGGAGSRDAASRGHGERGQQQQLLGHRPARAAVTVSPRGAAAGTVPTETATGSAGSGCRRRQETRNRREEV